MAKKRYYVCPLDNCGTVDPPPPRDRTWTVIDRQTDGCVGDFFTRTEARAYCAELNNQPAVAGEKGTDHDEDQGSQVRVR